MAMSKLFKSKSVLFPLLLPSCIEKVCEVVQNHWKLQVCVIIVGCSWRYSYSFNASEYCPCIETPDVMKFPLAIMEEESNDKDFGSY